MEAWSNSISVCLTFAYLGKKEHTIAALNKKPNPPKCAALFLSTFNSRISKKKLHNLILKPFLRHLPVHCFSKWNTVFAFLISLNHKQGRHHNCCCFRVPPHTLVWFWISIVPTTGGLPGPQMSNYMVCPILLIAAKQFLVQFHRNLNSYSEITHSLLNYITTELHFVILIIKNYFSFT